MPTPRNAPPKVLTIAFKGEDLPFKLDTNGWCLIEERHSKSTMAIIAELSPHPSLTTLRHIIAVGLSTPDAIYSEAEAGEVIGAIGLGKAVEMIGASIESMMDPAT